MHLPLRRRRQFQNVSLLRYKWGRVDDEAASRELFLEILPVLRSNCSIPSGNPNNRRGLSPEERCQNILDSEERIGGEEPNEWKQECPRNYHVQGVCIRIGRIFWKAETKHSGEVPSPGRQVDFSSSHERQKALPKCLLNKRWIHLCFWRVLRKHGIRD